MYNQRSAGSKADENSTIGFRNIDCCCPTCRTQRPGVGQRNAACEITKIEVARIGHAKAVKIHRGDAIPMESSLADDPRPVKDPYDRDVNSEAKLDAWYRRHPDVPRPTPLPAFVAPPFVKPVPKPAPIPAPEPIVASEPAPLPASVPEDFTKMSSEERQERIRQLKEEQAARLQKLRILTESAA